MGRRVLLAIGTRDHSDRDVWVQALSFDVSAWLNEPLGCEPRHRRICQLLQSHGAFNIGDWATMEWARRGQKPIKHVDMLDFAQVKGFMEGLIAAGVEVEKALRPHMDKWRADLQAPALN